MIIRITKVGNKMESFVHISILLLTTYSIHCLERRDCISRQIGSTLCNIDALSSIDLTFLDATRTFDLELVCKSQELETNLFPAGKFDHLIALQALTIQDCAFLQIKSDAFQGLKSLTTLKILGDYENMKRINMSENLFAKTPLLQRIDLAIRMDKIPNRLFCNVKHLQFLNLTGNNLQYLDGIGCGINSSCCIQLEYLLLLASNIETIQSGVFNDLENLKGLSLQDNKLIQIDEKLFQNNKLLEQLLLPDNQLTYVPANVFLHLKSINRIILNDNKLFFNQSSKDMFKGLTSLVGLNLSSNHIEYLPSGLFDDLTLLKTLSLANNSIQQVGNSDFKFLTNLVELDLKRNNITKITEAAFQALKNLSVLRLNENRLKNIPNIQPLRNLYGLDLASNDITDITPDSFSTHGRLAFLTLSNNRLKELRNSTFKNTPNLAGIRLALNEISFIEDGTFQILKHLATLSLDGNKIRETKSLFVTVKKELDLDDNEIQVFNFTSISPELKILRLNKNRVRTFETNLHLIQDYKLEILEADKNLFQTFDVSIFPPNIRQIHMAGNNISHVKQFTAHKPKLWFVGLANNSITELLDSDIRYSHPPVRRPSINIANNPLICSCHNNWMGTDSQENYPTMLMSEETICRVTFSRIKKYSPFLQVIKIKMNQLFCENDKICLGQCSCYYNDRSFRYIMDCYNTTWSHNVSAIDVPLTTIFFDGNTNIGPFVGTLLTEMTILHTLYLNNSGLKNIEQRMFDGAPQLMILHLEENQLSSVKGSEFHFTTELVHLFLHQNQLEYISPGAFLNLTNLKLLTLHKNKLLKPEFWAMMPLQLSKITLSGNNFTCDCDFVVPFQQWIANHASISFSDLDDTHCGSSNVSVTKFNDTSCYEVAKSDNKIVLVIALTVSLCLFCAVLVILWYFFRVEMKVWLYSRYGVQLFYNNEDENADSGKVYSAFISYATEDEDWIVNELLPRLDDYKLCIHQRDFPVGEYIADSIISAVENSCRTVIILTPDFLQSKWCQFEFDTAHMQSLHDKCKRLVVVRLGDVGNCEMHTNLNAYLKTNTYLDINDTLFWDKLKYALPDYRIPLLQGSTETIL